MGLCAHCMCRSTMPPREHQQMFEKEQRPPHNSPEKIHQNSDKLVIRPDYPRRRIKIRHCMVGGLRCVVIYSKCHPNRSRGFGAVWGRKWPFPLLWPVAYTTACTTVQATVMSHN